MESSESAELRHIKRMSKFWWIMIFTASVFTSRGEVEGRRSAEVFVSPATELRIGGVSELDRYQFFLIHGTPDEIPLEQLAWLRERTSAPFARSVNFLSHSLREVPNAQNAPGFKDRAALEKAVDELIAENRIAGDAEWVHVGLSMHPQDLLRAEGRGWGGDSDTGRAEALAVMLQRLSTKGWKPPFFEPMNEPRDKLKVMGVDMDRVIEFHRNVIPKLREALPGILIGGFAEFEIRFNDRDFGNWRDFMGKYLENVGDPGDFISFHPYAINARKHTGGETMAGSVIEASLDLVAASAERQFGRRVPMLVSEYGLAGMAGQASLFHHYSPRRDFEIMREINGQLFSYLTRHDMMVKAIPFIVPHSEWWKRSQKFSGENPHSPWELFHEVDGKWTPTHLVKFYELWEPVRGTRLLAESSDPDIPVAAFRDGDNLWLCLHNLSDQETSVTLHSDALRLEGEIMARRTSLILQDDEPVLEREPFAENTLTLRPHETAVLEMPSEIAPGTEEKRIQRETAFAQPTLVPITAERLALRAPGSPRARVGRRR